MNVQQKGPANQRGRWFFVTVLALFFLTKTSGQIAPPEDIYTRDWAVEVFANISESPPQIQLNWRPDSYATEYRVYRKLPSETSWGQIGTASGNSSGFVDSNVTVGTAYEYQIVGDKIARKNLLAYGYILSGIKVPLVEYRGRVILLTESSIAAALKPELDAYEYQLIGDGWTVVRDSVGRNDSVQSVRDRIRSLYAQDPANTRTLILFGNIPVPYSGDISPDQHPNHTGAWPADVYYADLDGAWTDSSVNDTQAERPTNHNVPGDGKFDQSTPPSSLELEVGRIDLSNLTCYANKASPKYELDLMRRYLDKDFRFRNGIIQPATEALLYDEMGINREPEPLTARAWRSFPPLVGPNITEYGRNQYFPLTAAKTYLWSSASSGGSYIECDYVGTSDDLALHDVNVIFTTFIGSYFGDWNNESNFLRAALATSGSLLTTCYAGKPQWLFHHMALGTHIGYSTKLTQENGPNGLYPPHAPGTAEVHISLLGDPTLRMHPVAPVQNVAACLTETPSH
jgi:hypothetical protein